MLGADGCAMANVKITYICKSTTSESPSHKSPSRSSLLRSKDSEDQIPVPSRRFRVDGGYSETQSVNNSSVTAEVLLARGKHPSTSFVLGYQGDTFFHPY